jgi:hypothetical protein
MQSLISLRMENKDSSQKAYRIECKGHQPAGRQGFGSALSASDLYVFGGRLDDKQRERIYSNDFWRFSLKEKEWHEIKIDEEIVSKRHNCSLTVPTLCS